MSRVKRGVQAKKRHKKIQTKLERSLVLKVRWSFFGTIEMLEENNLEPLYGGLKNG